MLVQGGHVVAFNGKGHEILKDRLVVLEDEADLRSRVQAEGEAIWGKVPEWDFRGRRADEISPWAFPLRRGADNRE